MAGPHTYNLAVDHNRSHALGVLSVTIVVSTILSCVVAAAGQTAVHIPSDQWVMSILRDLSTDEKIGQLLQIRIYGDYQTVGDPHYQFILSEIHRFHIGSVELSSRMAGPNLVKPSPLQVAKVLNELQGESQLPLLVGGDFERGLSSRLSGTPEFPFPMAFGAAGDQTFVEKYAEIVATQARAVGVHWLYAPTADLNSNPSNPIINTRSFGENAGQVARLVAAYIGGAHKNGVLVTAKHFPGEGDTSEDPHVGLLRIGSSRDHLDKYELPPFRSAIAAGVDAIMLAHAGMSALDPDPHRLATTSPIVIDGLLRRHLGFNGVVITDALEMNGLKAIYPGEADPIARASVDAIKAGADVVMVMDDAAGAFEVLRAAVRSGEISESRIDVSVRRILTAKASLGLQNSRFVDLNSLGKAFDAESRNLAQAASDAAVTLVRSDSRVLPLQTLSQTSKLQSSNSRASGSLAIVSFSDSQFSPLSREFENQLRLRRPDAVVLHVFNDGIGSAQADEVLSLTQAADKVVIAAFVTHVPSRRIVQAGRVVVPVGLAGSSALLLGEILAAAPQKTIVIALGSPYLIENFPAIQNYMCTYSLTPTAELTAVKALFGEIHNQAKLPVTLPGVATRGFSVPWPSGS